MEVLIYIALYIIMGLIFLFILRVSGDKFDPQIRVGEYSEFIDIFMGFIFLLSYPVLIIGIPIRELIKFVYWLADKAKEEK